MTGVVIRDGDAGHEILLVQRADTHQWAPVTGVVDPGEHPDAAIVREVLEETCITSQVKALRWVAADPEIHTHVNGDQAWYLDHTFLLTYVSGDARVGDDESIAVGWFPLDCLPDLAENLLQRIRVALVDEHTTRLGEVHL